MEPQDQPRHEGRTVARSVTGGDGLTHLLPTRTSRKAFLRRRSVWAGGLAASLCLFLGVWLAITMHARSATGQSAEATAQPSPTESPTPAPTTDADALLRDARQLQASGDRDGAFQLYQQVMTQAAGKPIAQQAALRAGICLEEGQRPQDAIPFYEQAAAGKPGYFRTVALYCKARSHHVLGQTADALQLLRLVRAESPIGKYARMARLLQSQIEGLSEADAQELVARDEYAANIYRQGRDALKAGNPLLAVRIFHEVLSGYGDTGAGFQSLRGAGEAFWHLNRYEEMCQTYAELRQRIRALPNTPHWRGINRTIDYRVGWYRATELHRQLLQQRIGGQAVPDEQWDRLYVLCDRWKGNAPTPADRATADQVRIESLAWQGRSEQVIEETNRFLQTYTDGEFRREIATVRFFAGEELQKLQRYDEALEHFRWVVRAYQGKREIWPGTQHLERTYFRIWQMLRITKRPLEEINSAADALLEQFPESPFAKHCRIATRQDEEWASYRAWLEAGKATEE